MLTLTTCPPGDRKSTRLNSSHSQISYAVFCLKKTRLGPFLPVPAFRNRPERRLEFFHTAFDAGREILGDFPFRHETAQQLPRLLEVLRRLIPKSPVIREEFRDVSGVDGFVIGIRGGFHVVSEEEDDEVHEVLARNPMNLELFEHHVRERNRGTVELQSPVARFLSEPHIVAEFELVEEDVDVEAVRTFVVHQPAFPEEAVDDVAGPEAQTVEQLADRPALARVPHQVEIREKRRSLLDAADAMEDRDALGNVQRVRVDAEGSQDSERGSSRMGRVNDRSRLAEELDRKS